MFSILASMSWSGIIENYKLVILSMSVVLPVEIWSQEKPEGLLLTWRNDPTTSMVIDWHITREGENDSIIHYRKTSDSIWQNATGFAMTIPFLRKTIYRKELTELSPGTRYAFRVGHSDQIYYFETMPQDLGHEPLVFAIGGNALDQEILEGKACMDRMTNLVAKYKPRFLLWSGQWPDDGADKDILWKWHKWFDAFQNGLIDSQGLVIPVIIPAGHSRPTGTLQEDLHGMTSMPVSNDHSGLHTWDMGEYLSILHLDHHLLKRNPQNQIKALKKALRQRKNRPHVFPVYQAQAFPAIQSNQSPLTQKLKQYWTPLFDRYEIPVVFEFQENRYKRTTPIFQDKPFQNGTIYIGHGGWNTANLPPRQAHPAWYIDQKIRERTIILMALHGENRYIRAVNEFGQIVDEYPHLFEQPRFTNTFSTLLPKGGITLSAELASTYGKVHVEAMPSAALGEGYARFEGASEPAGLRWKIPSHNTNDYSVRFRYSHSDTDEAEMQLLINGEVVEEKIIFSDVGSTNRWHRSSLINVVLQKGLNHIEIRTLPGKPSPRIDRLEIFPAVF